MIWKCRLDGYKYYEYFNNQHQTASHAPDSGLTARQVVLEAGMVGEVGQQL